MSAAEDKSSELVANAAQKAETDKLFELRLERTELGRVDSLRYNILTWVLSERYDAAINELKDLATRPSDFPEFNKRAERFLKHAVDLVFAIRAKRTFSGINLLTRSKQQELREKFKEHFSELQQILKKIEKIERDLKIEDMRSTIYVIRALWFAVISIILSAFAMELVRSLAHTSFTVAEDFLTKSTNWLFELLGM